MCTCGLYFLHKDDIILHDIISNNKIFYVPVLKREFFHVHDISVIDGICS